MLSIWAYTLASIFLVSIISLVGILSIMLNQDKLRKILLYLVSLSAGALIGDSFIHLLPEAINEYGFTLKISVALIFGILFSYIIETIIQWKHTHHLHSFNKKGKHVSHKPDMVDDYGHEIDCQPHCSFAYMNLVGDSFHNFIDGVIIAASYMISIPVGVATTLAVILHEIPQEIGDFGVLLHGGFKIKKALFFNFLTALFAVVGGVLTLLLKDSIQDIAMYLIPFAAGNFIYIAVSDLFPELRKEKDMAKSAAQLFFIFLGIAMMLILLLID